MVFSSGAVPITGLPNIGWSPWYFGKSGILIRYPDTYFLQRKIQETEFMRIEVIKSIWRHAGFIRGFGKYLASIGSVKIWLLCEGFSFATYMALLSL